jgi:hypothetical protein
MPRFFFHVPKGEVFERDEEGREIAATGSLSEEAMEASRDLLAEGDLQGLDRRERTFEIADEAGQTVLTFPFEAAIQPDLPDPDA